MWERKWGKVRCDLQKVEMDVMWSMDVAEHVLLTSLRMALLQRGAIALAAQEPSGAGAAEASGTGGPQGSELGPGAARKKASRLRREAFTVAPWSAEWVGVRGETMSPW